MRVLVTGGAGYIGSHAVRALQRAGHQPVVLDNLVYGHRAVVEDVLRVPLVVSQVGDRALLDQVLSGSHPVLADGSCIRDDIHVSDLADAHVLGLGRLMRQGNPGPGGRSPWLR